LNLETSQIYKWGFDRKILLKKKQQYDFTPGPKKINDTHKVRISYF